MIAPKKNQPKDFLDFFQMSSMGFKMFLGGEKSHFFSDEIILL